MAPIALCLVVRQCRLATCLDDGHALAVAGIAPDGAGDLSGRRKHASPDKSGVPPGYAAGRQRGRQPDMGVIRLGDDHQTAGVLVETMNDARAGLSSDAGKGVSAVGKQRVDEGSAGMTGAGMDHESGRLVDDKQMLVLMNDDERNVLANQGRLGRPWHLKNKAVPRFDPQ